MYFRTIISDTGILFYLFSDLVINNYSNVKKIYIKKTNQTNQHNQYNQHIKLNQHNQYIK